MSVFWSIPDNKSLKDFQNILFNTKLEHLYELQHNVKMSIKVSHIFCINKFKGSNFRLSKSFLPLKNLNFYSGKF